MCLLNKLVNLLIKNLNYKIRQLDIKKNKEKNFFLID